MPRHRRSRRRNRRLEGFLQSRPRPATPIPGTASTARMNSSTVPTVSAPPLPRGRGHGPPFATALVAPPTSVADVRTAATGVRLGARGSGDGNSRRRRASFAAPWALPDSGEWQRTLRHRFLVPAPAQAFAAVPGSGPAIVSTARRRSCVYRGREREYVLPLYVESELFQLGETQAHETLRQGRGLVPQALAKAFFETTEPFPPPTQEWAPEDSAEAGTAARPLCPAIRGGSSP